MKHLVFLIMAFCLISGCSSKDIPDEKTIGSPNQSSKINSQQTEPKEIVGIGKVEPENEIIKLAATSGGIINEIYKKDGEKIMQGEPLLKLDDDIEQLRIAQFKNQVITQQTQMEFEKAALQEIEVTYANKKQKLTSIRNLVKKGAEAIQNSDDLETEVKTLEMNLAKSKISIRLAQNRLNELLAQLKLFEAEATKKTLRSPYTGILLEMLMNKGAAINQFENYANMAPEGKNIIRAEVDELFCTKLRDGQSVDIRYIGSEQNITSGRIVFLSPYLKKKSLFSEKANDQEDRRVREIRITFQEKPELIINSKVECVIKL